jgi:hypothetical protein
MKDSKVVQDKSITLAATAQIFPGGILLKSDACQSDVSVHFKDGYERESNANALASLQRFQRRAYESQFPGADMKARDATIQVVFEGMLTKNPNYHLEFDRGAATLAAWDYHQEYAFVVARVISVEK